MSAYLKHNKDGEGESIKVPPLDLSNCRIKICRKCEKGLELHNYYKDKKSGDGLRSICKGCLSKARVSDCDRYADFKYSAKRRGIEFDLTKDEFSRLRNQPCFYCGDAEINMSIDRIDSLVGYTSSNCMPSCISCNFAKQTLDIKQFFTKISKIYNRHKKIGNIE